MIVTLSGVTGIGKSFLKDEISKELNFKNLAIVTTRPKRAKELNGIDKEFVNEAEFEKLKKENKIAVDFEFLGAKYAYRKNMLQSSENQVTELHYNTIYEFKKQAKDLFTIYIVPYDIKRAKQELKKRKLPLEVERKRLQEIDEHIKEYSNNADLRKQFDYVFVNDYTDGAKNELLQIIKEKINSSKKEERK